jgi:hypothetical protein
MRYSEAVRAVIDEKPLQPKRPNAAVLEATTKLDEEIHRLMAEEHFTDYHEGIHYVLSSIDPRHCGNRPGLRGGISLIVRK